MRCKIPSRDLALKLNDTICRYKGDPVWVKVIDGGLYLYHLEEVNSSSKYFAHIASTDPDFDVAGVPLGYIQGSDKDKHKVSYLSRVPIRKVKQGLPLSAIRVNQVGGEDRIESSVARVLKGSNNSLLTKNFSKMVKNDYPRLPDAMKMLRGLHSKDPSQVYQVAIRRDIAIEINQMGIINVHYKRSFVGWIQPDKNVVHIPKSDMSWVISKYLSDHLDWVVD